VPALQKVGGEEGGGVSGGGGEVDEAGVGFAPGRGVDFGGRERGGFDFADAVEDGLPEVAEDDEWFCGHDALVEHFPDDGKLDQRAGAAFAGDVGVAAADEFKETVLPCLHTDFLAYPGIGATAEEGSGDSEDVAAGFAGTAGDRFHDAGVASGADAEAAGGEFAAKREGFGVVRVAFAGAGRAEDGDGFGRSHEAVRFPRSRV